MNAQKSPTWLKVLLGLVALFVLGPPLLALVLGTVGVLFALTGALLKVGLVVGAVYVLYRLLAAMFGGGSDKPQVPAKLATIDAIPQAYPVREDDDSSLEREDRARKAELDRELERAIAAANEARQGG